MRTRHLVDPELLSLADSFPDMPINDGTLPSVREFSASMIVMGDPEEAGVERREKMVPGLAGEPDVRCLIYTPEKTDGPLPAYLHLHGGGYVLGSPEGSDIQNISLAAELGCMVVSVDYRLAPGFPYPAALNDAYAGLSWLFDNAAMLGVDPARIAIGGESAGGGLAAALGLKARDEGVYQPCFQLLVYPMVDDRTGGEVPADPLVGEYLWNAEKNRYGWASYLGDADPERAAPARAASLAGLPPTWIGVGTLDLFLDEDITYARRLIAAEVATELKLYPSAFHGFSFNPEASISKTYEADYRAALRRAFK